MSRQVASMMHTRAVAQVFEVTLCFLLMIAAMTILSRVVRRYWGEDMAINAICASTILILGSILTYAVALAA